MKIDFCDRKVIYKGGRKAHLTEQQFVWPKIYYLIGKFRPEGMRSLFATVNNFDLEYIFGLIFRYMCKDKPLLIYTYNAILPFFIT